MRIKIMLAFVVMLLGLFLMVYGMAQLEKKPLEPKSICLPLEEIESACSLKCLEFNNHIFKSFNETDNTCVCININNRQILKTSLLDVM